MPVLSEISIFTAGTLFGAVAAFFALAKVANLVNHRRVRGAGPPASERLEIARARLEQIAALDPVEPRSQKIANKALGEI